MRLIQNIKEAEEVLAKYVPLTKSITGRDITLDRMRPLMNALGNPQDRLKIIHLAGTSGKTSTSYYIATLLQLSGKRVGLTVSPHVDVVTERLQINGKPVGEQEFCALLTEFMELIESAELQPTYFELLVALAYWYFAKQEVDYAVVETGMGGLHDATNIADSPNKVCVITDIGLDHMHVLGNTISEITAQKAGIIYGGNHVFMHRQTDEVMDIITKHSNAKQAKLHITAELPDDAVVGLPEFQRRNLALAYGVFEHLRQRDSIKEVDLQQLDTARLQVPGRMEEVRIESKKIILDGAHNEQKTQAFTQSFTAKYPGRKVPILLSLKLGKEFAAVLPLLKPITSKLIITNYEASQDLPIKSIDAKELAAAAKNFGFEDVVTEPDSAAAFNLLLEATQDMAIITGSFYLIGQLRREFVELKSEQSA